MHLWYNLTIILKQKKRGGYNMRYTIYNLKKKGKNSFFFLLIVILVATIILSTSMFNLWGEKVTYTY